MSDEQCKRDEDRATALEYSEDAIANQHNYSGGAALLEQTQIQQHFLAGLAHCRETEVKGLKAENMCDACCGEGRALSGPCMCGGTGKMSDAARHLRIELYKSREQLRVAVEALHKAKSRYWERCYDGSIKTPALTLNEFDEEVDEALQKIEAMKGGGDE